MNRLLTCFFRFSFCCLVLLTPLWASAQHTDSAQLRQTGVSDTAAKKIAVADTAIKAADSLKPVLPSRPDTSLQAFYGGNSYVPVNAPLQYRFLQPFQAEEKDFLFYLAAALLLLLAIVRVAFVKYFSDLFRIFFQTTFRQKSIREQLLQNKMGSLLLNVFFCVSGGLFLYQAAAYKGWLLQDELLKNLALCIALVAIVYGVKYVGLQLSGWLFGMQEVADTYTFIVFLINKVVGVLLLPAILALAFAGPKVKAVLLMASLLGLGLLYLYRYFIAMPLVRSQAKVSGFHFFLYLCAFEIVPVLVLYKLLLIFLSR